MIELPRSDSNTYLQIQMWRKLHYSGCETCFGPSTQGGGTRWWDKVVGQGGGTRWWDKVLGQGTGTRYLDKVLGQGAETKTHLKSRFCLQAILKKEGAMFEFKEHVLAWGKGAEGGCERQVGPRRLSKLNHKWNLSGGG